MSDSKQILTLEILQQAVAGNAAAFRCVTEYQPMGGAGDKVFPPTYEGGKYATEKRVDPATGEIVDCVLLDSVQSQANRMELALQDAIDDGRLALPLLKVAFTGIPKPITITSLEAPHRVADAIFRDSRIKEGGEWKTFRKSAKGNLLDHADLKNATGLFGLCPTALVFGMWDSTGPRGGLGAKFQRVLVSEMVGYDATLGVTTGGKVDHLNILIDAGKLYQRHKKTDDQPAWTLNKELSDTGKLIGKHGKPSEANLGGVTPDFAYAKDPNGNIIREEDKSLRIKGGFTFSKAVQTTVLSLPALRRLRFPLGAQPQGQVAANSAARTALAALGLAAATLARAEGADLRSRCQLFPTGPFVWELLDQPGAEPRKFELNAEQAVALLRGATKIAQDAGLPWEGIIELTPSDDLMELVRRSQDLAAKTAGED